MGSTMSSMKVEPAVRERLRCVAQAEGRTVSEALTHLLDERDRRERFAGVAAAYDEVDAGYLAEIDVWDQALEDGLDDDR